jgi:ELWxxDGT repeat protein
MMPQDKHRARQLGFGLVLAACLLCGSSVRADGPARLVHDFFRDEFEGYLPVSQLTRLGSELFFVAEDLDSGQGVWRTDGTPAGTERVRISGLDGPGDVTIVGRVGERVLWLVAQDAAPGVQTLVSATERGDGIVLHTYAPKDLPRILGGSGGRFYFQDCGAAGCVVWSSDGTTAGTRPVSALARFQAENQRLLATLADQWLVFRSQGKLLAYDATRNRVLTLLSSGAGKIQVYPTGRTLYAITRHDRWRLWASRLEEPRGVQVFTSNFIDVMGWLGDSLYFATDDGQLWSTEGRRATNRPYTGLRVDPYSAFADELGAIGSKTFLPMPGYYSGGLLQTNETKREVRELEHVCSGKYSCLATWMSKVTVLGNLGFEEINSQLWVSDGSKTGTKRHDVIKETHAATFRALGDRLLLGGTSYEGEQQLWETDGIASGTRALTDATLDRPFKVESAPVPFAGALFVAADQKPVGKQLWRVADGHATAVTDLQHLPSGIDPYSAVSLGDRIVVRSLKTSSWLGLAEDGSAERLPVDLVEGCWFNEIPCPLGRVVVGDRLVFSPSPGVDLWSTDGTASGTGALPMSAQLVALGRWRDEALAVGYDGSLWASDGTASGTHLVAEIPVSPELERHPVGPPIAAGPLLYLFRRVIDGYVETLELWRTDGTEDGTLRLTSIPFPYQSYLYLDPSVVGGRLFFRHFGVLWTSDGSVVGTQPFPQELPGGAFAVAAGTEVLYAASGAVGSQQILWAIDPATLEATVLSTAARFAGGVAGTPLGSLIGNTLFFKKTGEDQSPEQWWVTEGTPASTHPLPEPLASDTAAQFMTAGDRRYFTACEPEHGCELWSTDRLGEDTRPVQDLWPGPRSSDPVILSATETSLLFAATDPEVGRELWEIDVSALSSSQGPALAQPQRLVSPRGSSSVANLGE